ncbi:MAG: transcriptional repressor [Anaerolineales bacterium]|nr:transcriptional repressor [Anaerolineales bacterium]MDW8161330.1 Fur family transcriptional regulator [Anaerolineales bacterium]
MTHCHTTIQSLRRQGFRITPQREMIIETLTQSNAHLSAEEIHKRIKPRSKTINLATVYRTLDLLVEQGHATRLIGKEGKFLYATRQHSRHLHLVCRKCGRAYAASYDGLQPFLEQLKSTYGFQVEAEHVTLYGLCPHCIHPPNQ